MGENKERTEAAFTEGWENEGFSEDVEAQESEDAAADAAAEAGEPEGEISEDAAGGSAAEAAEVKAIPVPMPAPAGGVFSDGARQRDFVTFAMEHPEVKNGDIPDEVWKRVIGGESLSSAWARHENEGLKQRIKEMEQAAVNRDRSTGSRSSSGRGERYDPFEEGWGEV